MPASRQSLINLLLHYADDSLILGHRNSEWTGHGPILEQDIAISNIALDLVGQARYLYQLAAGLINENNPAGEKATEDSLAYLRDAWDFRNCVLVEQSNGDWAKTILRQFLFSNYQYSLYESLQQSAFPELAAIAAKAIKETAYHVRWSSEWVVRLGDGTPESHRRMNEAIEALWKFTGELFSPADYEITCAACGFAPDLPSLKPHWDERNREIFALAKLQIPEDRHGMVYAGKSGIHTEALGYILAEMQFLQRAYPGCEW